MNNFFTYMTDFFDTFKDPQTATTKSRFRDDSTAKLRSLTLKPAQFFVFQTQTCTALITCTQCALITCTQCALQHVGENQQHFPSLIQHRFNISKMEKQTLVQDRTLTKGLQKNPRWKTSQRADTVVCHAASGLIIC